MTRLACRWLCLSNFLFVSGSLAAILALSRASCIDVDDPRGNGPRRKQKWQRVANPHRSRNAEIVTPSDGKIPRPSPKSTYRLADKYSIPALKTPALNHIRTCASVNKKIDNFVEGDLEHAAEMLPALWEIANKDGNITGPSKTTPAMSVFRFCLNPQVMRECLFYMIRPHKSRAPPTGAYNKAKQLNELVKYLKGRNPLTHNLEGDVNVENDCEGDSPGVKNETPKAKKEDRTRAVLVAGSFSVRDLVRSAQIARRYIRENTVAVAPPPCSPKSICILANLVRLISIGCLGNDVNASNRARNPAPLRQCLWDIENEMSLDNVVDKVLSRITAGQEKITEMQCELLVSSFKGPRAVALVKENIGRISDGSSSQCGNALKLGLKKAFELKRKKRQSSGTGVVL
ncbi:hypothetical protein BDM02DRAFT_3132344 [Thelephora ganbajun]|uniref:Uncharacterized protein n=1 Tax=Thelephora ganbajun TaxID=370292 RepID=A0ACB6Z1F4_THEGA|nr:hypothetical protein BDM02DRAFT_3132344 [Thelephora ganbajun]